MKKLVTIILCVSLILILFGCSKNDNNTNKKPNIDKGDDVVENTISKDDEFILDDIVSNDKKLKIAFIGDSITYGYLTDDPSSQCYCAQLNDLFGGKYVMGNFGKNAAYAIDADSIYNIKVDQKDRSYRNTEEYKKSLEFNADVVVIMLGVNDIRSMHASALAQDEFKNALGSLVQEYKELSTVKKVYVASSVLTHSSTDFINLYTDGILQGLQKEVADSLEVEFIDIYSATKNALSDTKYFVDDGVHLNASGQEQIALAFYNYFKK